MAIYVYADNLDDLNITLSNDAAKPGAVKLDDPTLHRLGKAVFVFAFKYKSQAEHMASAVKGLAHEHIYGTMEGVLPFAGDWALAYIDQSENLTGEPVRSPGLHLFDFR